jgi:hypothetical protein
MLAKPSDKTILHNTQYFDLKSSWEYIIYIHYWLREQYNVDGIGIWDGPIDGSLLYTSSNEINWPSIYIKYSKY